MNTESDSNKVIFTFFPQVRKYDIKSKKCVNYKRQPFFVRHFVAGREKHNNDAQTMDI